MATYKIINITSSLGKRNPNFNSTLSISYVDGMERKTILLKPEDTLYYTTSKLPISVQRYRMKNLVSIAEISEKELFSVSKRITTGTSKTVVKPTTTTTTTKKKTTKRKYTRKSSSSSTSKKETTTKKKSTS